MRQRVRQFFEASRKPGETETRLAAEWLGGAQLEAFLAQHPRDIVHSASTARWLIARGHRDPDLIGAALLHDIGKGNQRRRDRVVYVLVGKVGIVDRLAAPRSRFRMRRALARSVVHAEAGARRASTAGASARTVELIARHHEQAGADAMLALLQQADAQS